LEDAGVATGLAGAVAGLLARIERARFEPVAPGPDARRAYLAEAIRLLDAVDATTDGRRRRPRATGAATAGILVGLLALAVPSAAQQPPQDPFTEAVHAYGAGDFAAAAAGFRSFLEANPEDANAWYNLGTAQFR